MREIEIAGGGLAGLSLGIGLRKRGVPVLVREAGAYPRHKVCGEFINGVTSETLEVLGILGIFKNALQHSRTRWWIHQREVLDIKMTRPALGMTRWEMDVALKDLFMAEGGELRTRDRVVREGREGLVWAAGRGGQKESTWLGLKGHFQGVPLRGGLEMHLGDGGYVGLTPITKDGNWLNVCALFKKRTLRAENLITAYLRACALDDLADRLEAGELKRSSLTGVSGLQLGVQGGTAGLCSLGDAERMIPPFTGNGMSMAFEAAECALQPLVDYAQGREWSECCAEVADAIESRFQKRVALALRLQRFIETAGGRRILSLAARSGLLPFHWLHRQFS